MKSILWALEKVIKNTKVIDGFINWVDVGEGGG